MALLAGALLSLLSPSLSAQDTEKKPITERTVTDLGFRAYEPLYFILGDSGGFNAKFQLSFKYQLFRAESWESVNGREPRGLYLSYTQTSLWDLDELSSPFRDTSYKPRLFYLQEQNRREGKRLFFDFELGFAHESNGKAEEDSRALNMGYIKPTVSYYIGATRRFYIAPMVVSYIDKAENPDIAKYRGHVDLVVGYGSGNKNVRDWSAWALLRQGDDSDKNSYEINVAAPLMRLTSDHVNGWLLLQYFHGYGESLIDYNQRLQPQFRLGIGMLIQ